MDEKGPSFEPAAEGGWHESPGTSSRALQIAPDDNNIEAVFHGEADRSAPSVKTSFQGGDLPLRLPARKLGKAECVSGFPCSWRITGKLTGTWFFYHAFRRFAVNYLFL
ncbi:MAG: hypothetical protein P0Y59_05890 [Candidatus Sphingomonas phytovorans]|nr:hypothetical protein [Sphingomonas sp.]WEK01220.1 MAG: hypothetical protein P0Y59_05890 [Sphingomonas sp.]